MKIGRMLEWDKIKVGEVFYFESCYGLAVKTHKNWMFIVDIGCGPQDGNSASWVARHAGGWWEASISTEMGYWCVSEFYALPKAIARTIEPYIGDIWQQSSK